MWGDDRCEEMMEVLGSDGDMGGEMSWVRRRSEVGWEEVERNMGEQRG